MVKRINLSKRSCENCNTSGVEEVWNSESLVKRAKNTWIFPFYISVCRSCGFCFSSPGPRKEDLQKYHQEGYS